MQNRWVFFFGAMVGLVVGLDHPYGPWELAQSPPSISEIYLWPGLPGGALGSLLSNGTPGTMVSNLFIFSNAICYGFISLPVSRSLKSLYIFVTSLRTPKDPKPAY